MPCASCQQPTKKNLFGAESTLKACGLCRARVCPACMARPMLVNPKPTFLGMKMCCSACYKQKTADAFSRAADIYPCSNGSDSAPTVILLHGATAGKDCMSMLAKALTSSFRVVVPDLPRHGHRLDEVLSDDSACAVIRQTIADCAPDGGKAYVMGWSMGGWIAISFASRHPELCLGVLAGGCFIDSTKPNFSKEVAKMKRNVHMMDSMPVLRARLACTALRSVFKLCEAAAVEVLRYGVFYECWDEFWDMLASVDYVTAVRTCRVPLLLVSADKCTNNADLDTFVEAQKANSDKPVGAAVRRVQGRHVWVMNSPEEAATVMAEFANVSGSESAK